MFSEDDTNVTSIFGLVNTDHGDDEESDNETVNTTAAVTDAAELDMLDESSFSKPVLMRSIGHNKWIFGMVQLMKNPSLHEFMICENIIRGGDTPFSNSCAKIWHYYVERDTNDKNKIYQITEEYTPDFKLLNKQVHASTPYDYTQCDDFLI